MKIKSEDTKINDARKLCAQYLETLGPIAHGPLTNYTSVKQAVLEPIFLDL
jgi:hypothetical protein